MPRVMLGNPHPIWHGVPTEDPNGVTMVYVPDCKPIGEAVRDIGHGHHAYGDPQAQGLWRSHSAAVVPSWVECEANPELEAAIAAHFGGIPTGRPQPVE